MKVKTEKVKFHSLLEMRLNRYDSLSFRVYDSAAWLTVVCSAPLFILLPFEDMPFEHSRPDSSFQGRQLNFRVYKATLDQFYDWLSSALVGYNQNYK